MAQSKVDSLECEVFNLRQDVIEIKQIVMDIERNTRIDFYWVGKDLEKVGKRMDSMARARPKDYGWLKAISQGITAAGLKMMGL